MGWRDEEAEVERLQQSELNLKAEIVTLRLTISHLSDKLGALGLCEANALEGAYREIDRLKSQLYDAREEIKELRYSGGADWASKETK